MSLYKLEKPDLSRSVGLELLNLIGKIDESPQIRDFIFNTYHPKYLYWDKVRRLNPPNNISAEEIWALIKYHRRTSLNKYESVIKSEDDLYFIWQSLPSFEQFLYEIDMAFSDGPSPIPDEDKTERKRYDLRWIIEEAVASSQLEGASTTRKAGKQLILQNRKPKNQAEQMILNNYKTILRLEDEFRDTDLDINLLLELHRSITDGTIDDEDIGRLRRNSDKVNVVDSRTDKIYHIPPDEKFLNREIHRLIDYANDKLNDPRFVHPVIKAIFLHFWIGYLHPFTDGNGRLARAMFYWYLINPG